MKSLSSYCLLSALAMLALTGAASAVIDVHIIHMDLTLDYALNVGNRPIYDMKTAFNLGLQDLKNSDLLSGINLTTSYVNLGCGQDSGLKFYDAVRAAETKGLNTVGVIGPLCSSEATKMSPVSVKYKLPLVGTGSTSASLSNKVDHPYYSRVCVSDAAGSDGVVAFLKYMEMDRAAILNSGDSFGQAFADGFSLSYRNTFGKFVTGAGVFPDLTGKNIPEAEFHAQMMAAIKNPLESAVQRAHIKYIVWATQSGWSTRFHRSLYNLGIDTSDLVLLTGVTEAMALDLTATAYAVPKDYKVPHCVHLSSAQSGSSEAFQNRVREYAKDNTTWGLTARERSPGDGTWPYTPYTYDALMHMVTAINKTITAGGNPKNGDSLLGWIRNSTYAGLTGSTQLKPNGDRDAPLNLYTRAPGKDTATYHLIDSWTKGGSYTAAAGLTVTDTSMKLPKDAYAPGKPAKPAGEMASAPVTLQFSWVPPQLFGVDATGINLQLTQGSGTTEAISLASSTNTYDVPQPAENVAYCLSVSYTSRGGAGTFSEPRCLTYVPSDSLLVDSGTLVILVIFMVILWSLLTLPVLYFMNLINVPEKLPEMRAAVIESVLDALELACGLLIIIGFKSDMSGVDTALFILVLVSWVNIFGYAFYACSLLHTAAETLDMTPFHTFLGWHTTCTLLVIFPELILETLQYVDTNDMTDLVGVIGLSLDLGVRLKATTLFHNKGISSTPAVVDDPSEVAQLLEAQKEMVKEIAELQHTVQELQGSTIEKQESAKGFNFMGCMSSQP